MATHPSEIAPLVEPPHNHAHRDRIRVGLLGCGHWGSNVAAAAERVATLQLEAVADLNVDAAKSLAARMPSKPRVMTPDDLLTDRTIRAVLIVADAAAHFDLASAAVAAGKHVFVEKPLALSTVDSIALVNAAAAARVTLMVGHTFLYSEHVSRIENAVQRGDLGELRYVHLQRLAYGRFRQDANVIWNLGPHDVSILMLWAGRTPVAVRCVEYTFTRPSISDVAFLTLDFGDFLGHVHLSCIDPQKVRRATLAGTTGGIVYDDVDGTTYLLANGTTTAPQALTPDSTEPPLDAEMAHFADCIRTGSRPKTNGVHGTAVVAVLEAASASAAQGGTWIDIADSLSPLMSTVNPDPIPDPGSALLVPESTARMAHA